MVWMILGILMIASYFIGSISGAVIVSNIFYKQDIRQLGSGNAGMTNMMRVYGFWPGFLTFIIDAGKGAVVCAISKYIVFPYVFGSTEVYFFRPVYGVYLCGIMCLLGHVFPIFFKFKGGKGVATSIGLLLVCQWQVGLIAIAIFIITVLISKYISLGSIVSAFVTPFIGVFFSVEIEEDPRGRLAQFLLMAVICGIVIAKHHSNITRLIQGKENKFKIRK